MRRLLVFDHWADEFQFNRQVSKAECDIKLVYYSGIVPELGGECFNLRKT